MFDISDAGGKKGCGEGRGSNGLKPEVSSTGCGCSCFTVGWGVVEN